MRNFVLLVAVLLLFSGCADSVEATLAVEQESVGFWYGVWHGMLVPVAFIVSLFDESVAIYAVYNSGGWYDFGFVLGFIMVWGSTCKQVSCKIPKSKREQEWEEIGEKVERKVMHKLKDWADKDDGSAQTDEWDEISEKVEQKLKRKIREWAES